MIALISLLTTAMGSEPIPDDRPEVSYQFQHGFRMGIDEAGRDEVEVRRNAVDAVGIDAAHVALDKMGRDRHRDRVAGAGGAQRVFGQMPQAFGGNNGHGKTFQRELTREP